MKNTNKQLFFIIVFIILVLIVVFRTNVMAIETTESNIDLDSVEILNVYETTENDQSVGVVEISYNGNIQAFEYNVEEVEEKEDIPKEIPPFVPYIDCTLDRVLQYHIYNLCQEYDVEYSLVMAIIKVESNFQPDVTSYNGSSIGLMQINYCNHNYLEKNYGLNNLWDELQNVEGGIIILKNFINTYDGNINYALIGYNQGSVPSGVSETHYSRAVLENKALYDEEISINENEYYTRFE